VEEMAGAAGDMDWDDLTEDDDEEEKSFSTSKKRSSHGASASSLSTPYKNILIEDPNSWLAEVITKMVSSFIMSLFKYLLMCEDMLANSSIGLIQR
jgi:hypothetical protein